MYGAIRVALIYKKNHQLAITKNGQKSRIFQIPLTISTKQKYLEA